MYLLGKKIENISSEDIQRIITNGISESKILEYKKELKIDSGDDRKEFLYDITSLANTEGGVIIYGIEEQKDDKGQNTGFPSKITGITVDNKDKLIQKIEDLAKNNVEPNLNLLNIQILTVDKFQILIIGIPKTLGLPHMVTYNSTNKFYKRRNSGKYLLDVYELNNTFISNLSMKEKANHFREQRIREVRNLKFLPKLDIEGSYFMHVIPLGHFEENIIDLSDEINKAFLLKKLTPYNAIGWNSKYNFEGFLTSSSDKNNQIPFSYVQLFRDCSIEFYTSHFHFPKKEEPNKLDLGGRRFEMISIQNIKTSFDVLNFYKIEPPYAVYISLFDLDNAVIHIQDVWNNTTDGTIGKSELLFPSVVFNETTQDISKAMKSTFDILWQTANCTKSPYYSEVGERIQNFQGYI